MGHKYSMFNFEGTYNLLMHRDVTPYPESAATFDGQFGFKEPREEKVMQVSLEHMESANIPLQHREFCAHHFIDFLGCREREAPWVGRCAHEWHSWQNCLYDTSIDTFKEYERERRLLVRKKRIAEKKAKEEAKLAAEALSD